MARTCALALCLAVAGCATGSGSGIRAGERAEIARNYDLAVVEYAKALRANPDDNGVRLALDRPQVRKIGRSGPLPKPNAARAGANLATVR